MPIYPYACTACGHTFEVQQSFTDPSLTQCPECSGRLRKVFSSVGVVFKGSGFYRTDSRSNGTVTAGSGASSDGGGSTSTGSGSSASTGSGSTSSGSGTPASTGASPASSTPAVAKSS